ncbi:MAG: AI-2E family transporter [Cyanobacteria bacterium SIG30]|nr:AI-2E family transporter [Cyanobacteria bacterium SIG30]
MDQNVNKYLTTKNIIFFVMIVLFLVFLNHIIDVALMFFAAFVISATLFPLIDKTSKYMPRVLATALILLLSLALLLLFFVPLIVFTAKQGLVFVGKLPSMIETGQQYLANFTIFGHNIAPYISVDKLYNIAQEFAGTMLTKSVDFTKVLISSGTGIIAISIMVFYICSDKDAMKNGFVALFPEKFKEKATNILDVITNKVGGYIFAQVLAMIFVGLCTGLGLLILGNDNAILLGFLTSIFDIIPVVGPGIAVIICLVSAISSGFWGVLLTLVVCLIAQLLENQLLRPIVIGKLMNIHPLTIVLSLLIGAKFLGFWGVILGPAIASVVCVLIDELYIKPINNLDNSENVENLKN